MRGELKRSTWKIPQKVRKPARGRELTQIIMAAVYALSLASLPVTAFVDRANYLVYARDSISILNRHLEKGVMELLFNEPLWLLINAFLGLIFNPENIVRAIIFIGAFPAALFLLRSRLAKNPLILIMLLLFPPFIKNFIIHLRQGLALGFFLIAYQNRSHYLRFGGALLSGFVHSSFFFIAPFWTVSEIFKVLKLSSLSRLVLSVPLIAILFSLLPLQIASILGARQADSYVTAELGASGLGLLFWSVILIVILSSGLKHIKENLFAILILIHYLTSYFVFPPAARVLESGLPFIFIALSDIENPLIRRLSYTILIAFFLISYISRFERPGFGWMMV